MKRSVNFLCAMTLMSALCASFASCNEPQEQQQNEEETEIQLVSVSDEISDFFNDRVNLDAIGDVIFEEHIEPDFIQFPAVDSCVMINSAEELPGLPEVIFPGIEFDGRYPFIDFETHTLIVGMFLDKGGECLVSQCLIVEQSDATMNIAIGRKNDDEFHGLLVRPAYFWGIYPKIHVTTIHTSVTR